MERSQLWDAAPCPRPVPEGHFYLLSEDTKATEPPVTAAAGPASSLCNRSSFRSFFWFDLTDLLQNQRGNTNDMFNPDQLPALRRPREDQCCIITRAENKSPAQVVAPGVLSQLCHTPKPLFPVLPWWSHNSLLPAMNFFFPALFFRRKKQFGVSETPEGWCLCCCIPPLSSWM